MHFFLDNFESYSFDSQTKKNDPFFDTYSRIFNFTDNRNIQNMDNFSLEENKFRHFENYFPSSIPNSNQSSVNIEKIQTIESNDPNNEIIPLINTTNSNDSLLGKKICSQRNDNSQINKKKRRKHDKFSKDNIKRKIQVHYIKFLRDLLNHIIKEILGENIEFYPLDYKFTMKVNKESFIKLKKTSLGDIFKEHASPKYKDYQKKNKDIYDYITKKNETIKNILDKLYLEFINIYYKNIKKINLFKYGLDKDITLPNNINFYKNLTKTNEIDSSSDNKYNIKIKKIIESEFISPIFVCELY